MAQRRRYEHNRHWHLCEEQPEGRCAVPVRFWFGAWLPYLNSDGAYFHSELFRNGEPFCSVVEAKQDTYASRHPIELGVDFAARNELERAFALLADGGIVEMEIGELPWSPCAAIVIDPFGVRWFLSMPQHRPAEDWSPEDGR